jgi:hypothetical protein
LPTPVSRSPLNGYEGISPDDLNQLLGTHAPYIVYAPSGINAVPLIGPTLGPSFAQFQALDDGMQHPLTMDQPFTMSGTLLDRIVLPMSIETGIGQDVLVGLYADSGGAATGLPIAQTYVPREFLQSSPCADFNGVILSPWWQVAPNTTLPANLAALSGQSLIDDGVGNIYGIGGWDGATTTVFVVSAPFTGNGLGAWTQTAPLPVSLAECGLGFTSDGFIMVVGGIHAGGVAIATVYSSQATVGTVAAWTTQTPIPQALFGAAVTVIGTNMYVVGGSTGGGVSVSTVYMSPLTAGGTTGAWTTPTNCQLPVALEGVALVQINGWLVALGGLSNVAAQSTVYAAPINAVTGTIGSWVPWPSFPLAGGAINLNAWVVDNNIIIMSGTYSASLAVNSDGPANAWVTQPLIAYPPSYGYSNHTAINGTLILIGTANVSGGTAQVNTVPSVSVPLHATGLTNGNVYHIVVAPVGLIDGVNRTQLATTGVAPSAAFAVARGKTGSASFMTGQNILPAYLYTAPQSGWDTPVSGRLTSNVNVTYAGGVITMTAILAATMKITTENPLATSTGGIDITGPYTLPVIGGVSYTFTATCACAVTAQTVLLDVLFADINGNMITTSTINNTGIDSIGGTVISATGIAPPNAAFAALIIDVVTVTAPGEVHTAYGISFNQNFGYVPLSLYISGKSTRPIHVLDDITVGQPLGWNGIMYNYAGQPLQIGECILPRVNMIASNDSNMGGPILGTVTGWTAGANTALAAAAAATQPLGSPVPATPSVPAWPVINGQQCGYEMTMTNSSGGASTIFATTQSGTSGYAVTPGQYYTAFAYCKAVATGRNVTVAIIWYNAAGGVISTSNGAVVFDVTTGWKQVYVNAVAPALAVTAAVSVSVAATAAAEVHAVTCVQFALDNSIYGGFWLEGPMLAYFEPGAGPGGMRNFIVLDYDPVTSQLVSITPYNPLTYFGTGLTATYTATGMTDTQAQWPMNGLVGLMISAPVSLLNSGTSDTNAMNTTATVAYNTGNTIILTAAGWSNGQPDNGSPYSIT